MQQHIDPFAASLGMHASAIVLLLLIVGTLMWTRALELRLILIGIFMAVAGSVQGGLAGLSGPGGTIVLTATTGPSGMTRVATILILAGVTLAILNRTAPTWTADGPVKGDE